MMTKKDMIEIFYPIIEKDKIEELHSNYSEIEDLDLSDIGIDSLGILSIVLNLEQKIEKEIDISNLNINSINSLNKIERFVYGNINI